MTTIASHIRVATALAVAVFAVATALPAASAHVAETEVKIDNFAFAPQRVVVKAGTTVIWINDDDIPHTVASSAKLFKSNALDTNDKFSFTFNNGRSVRVFLLPASAHDGNHRGRGGDRK
jgi:plastocyanin